MKRPIYFVTRSFASLVIAASLLTSTGRSAEPNTLTPQELSEGWVLLFDGESLFGWTASNEANWAAKDGVISVSEGQGSFLATNSEFGDYELKVDFRCPVATNSGVFLRTPLRPKSVATDCYELNIAPPNNPFPTGGFVGRQKADGADPKHDEWNTFDVTAKGGHLVIKLNGKQVLDYTDLKPVARGMISLQLNQGKVEFRNIKLRPLGLKSIFTGTDLAGWKAPEGSKSVATVAPGGWLSLKGGKGALESEGQFGDFILQFEGVNAKDSNSGVFFRSIPGQMMNGYECQIDHRYKNNDRTQPTDGGTGAIYRRQAARKVVPNDTETFYATLAASGNHMACWINGYLVTDCVDTRDPHENPRNGTRTAAGTLQLQGHDPKSDVLFRNMKAGELPR